MQGVPGSKSGQDIITSIPPVFIHSSFPSFPHKTHTGLRLSYHQVWRVLESIQGIHKRPTYRFEDTIVWERWYFWTFDILIYRLIQCIRGFCSSHLPIFKLSLQVSWIDSSNQVGMHSEVLFTRISNNKNVLLLSQIYDVIKWKQFYLINQLIN